MLYTRIIATVCMALCLGTAQAQTDDQYRMEIGGGVGMMTYEGDFNGSIASGMKPMACLLYTSPSPRD